MNRPPPWSSLGEQFLRFSKNDLSWINLNFLLFDTRKSCVFQIFLLTSIKAYLCPNIINFDSVDFSERRPEEVISFFWRSVYHQSNILSTLVYSIFFSSSSIIHHLIQGPITWQSWRNALSFQELILPCNQENVKFNDSIQLFTIHQIKGGSGVNSIRLAPLDSHRNNFPTI